MRSDDSALQPAFLSRATAGVAGLAPYEPGKPVSELAREYGVDDITKLASNEGLLGPCEGALQAIRAGLEGLGHYPDGNGFELKRALARRHGLAPESITLGNGSNDVLDLVARAFLEPGRNAVFSRYAFAVYPIVTRAAGAECRAAPALPPDSGQPYGHDPEAMLACVDGDTGVVFLANPNNPTGTWISRAVLGDFLERLPERVVAVVDEAYFEFVDEPEYPDASRWLDDYPNLVVTRTFSKVHGLAGLRVGYALSHPALADLLNRVRQPFNVNDLAQRAAAASLADPGHVERAVELNREGMAQLREGLDALGLAYIPSVANFLCVEVGDAAAVYEKLLRAGIIVRPMAGYELPRHVRVTAGLPEENARFLTALGEVLGG